MLLLGIEPPDVPISINTVCGLALILPQDACANFYVARQHGAYVQINFLCYEDGDGS